RLADAQGAFALNDPGFQFYLVPRTDLAAETAVFDPAEVRCFSFVFLFAENSDSACLRQGFHCEDSRHYRLLGKMAPEKVFMEGHAFISYRILSRLIVLYIIHQQKRMSVGDDLFNFFDTQSFHFSHSYCHTIRNSGWPYSTA